MFPDLHNHLITKDDEIEVNNHLGASFIIIMVDNQVKANLGYLGNSLVNIFQKLSGKIFDLFQFLLGPVHVVLFLAFSAKFLSCDQNFTFSFSPKFHVNESLD